MSKFIVNSKAKINLSLDILSKREDGYHNLSMIMHTVNLCDTLTFDEKKEKEISLSSNLPYLPCDSKNIVYKAYETFYNNSGVEKQGFDIHINKSVPVCAGLDGGSTNAASTLLFLNRYHNNPLSLDTLMKIGKELGADVPYGIIGGTCLAEGIGEKLTSLPSLPECYIVIAKPQNKGLSTKSIFSMVNIADISLHPDTHGMIKALYDGDLKGVCKRMYNVLEYYSVKESPEISKYKEILIACDALGALMSGSGNAVFGIFETKEAAEEAFSNLKKETSLTFLV